MSGYQRVFLTEQRHLWRREKGRRGPRPPGRRRFSGLVAAGRDQTEVLDVGGIKVFFPVQEVAAAERRRCRRRDTKPPMCVFLPPSRRTYWTSGPLEGSSVRNTAALCPSATPPHSPALLAGGAQCRLLSVFLGRWGGCGFAKRETGSACVCRRRILQ